MNEKFPILKSILSILKIFGYLLLVIGFVYLFLYEGVIEPSLPNHHFASTDMFQLQLGIGVTFVSLIVIAFCELTNVFLEIEKNTRK